MNMMKLRQILELRRANKAPPLIPPKTKCGSDTDNLKKGPKEIIDVHLNLRNFKPGAKSKSDLIVLIFSQSEDSEEGWKVTTSSDLIKKAETIDLNSVVSIEFKFERCQYIKLDICDWREFNAISLGYTVFAVSELVTQRDGAIIRDVVDDESGQTVANVLISSSLRPKPHSILLQFFVKNLTTRKNIVPSSAQVFFEVHKVCGDEDENTVLYRSECTKYGTKILFKTFSVQSTDMLNNTLEIDCFYRDSKNPKVQIGSFEANYDQLSHGVGAKSPFVLTYETSKNQKKVCGEFDLLKFNEMILPSFLEFVSTGTAINVSFAVDLTQSEKAVDAEIAQRYVNDVELAIKSIGEPLRDFNATNSYAAFGFGAKIPPQFRESQEFCLNLETDPHCRGVDGVIDAFRTAFAQTQPMNIAHLSHVIYYVSKLAQNAANRSKNSVYYVLIVITRGVFDDIKETVQSLIFASRAPISVIFVGVGEMDLSELQRLGSAGTRLNYHGRKPERDCGQSVLIPKCREEEENPNELRSLIAERALSQIPWQMTTWMSRNGIKPPSADQPSQTLHHEMYGNLEYSWHPIQSAVSTPSTYSISEQTISGDLDESPQHSMTSQLTGSSDGNSLSRHSTASSLDSQKQRDFRLRHQQAFDHINVRHGTTSAIVHHSMPTYEESPTHTSHQKLSHMPRKISHPRNNHKQYAYEQQMAFEQVQSLDVDSDSLQSIASIEPQHLKSSTYSPHQQITRHRNFRSQSVQSPSPPSFASPSSRQGRY